MKVFELRPTEINMAIFKQRVANGAWEVMSFTPEGKPVIAIFTGALAESSAKRYCEMMTGQPVAPVETDIDLSELF